MPTQVRSYWPDVIRATVQSPLSILSEQAEAITEQTGGVLVGKVVRGVSDDERTTLALDIVVPELKNYRHRILTVNHLQTMPYPTTVDADVFRPTGPDPLSQAWQLPPILGGQVRKPENRADTDQEFVELIKKVFQSPSVVSVAQSLVARAEDVRAGRELAMEHPTPPAPSPPTDADPDQGSKATS